MFRTSLLAGALAGLLLVGCAAQVGPRTVPPARFDYSEALARSWDQQLLLNLVRLRYRDTPLFLDVGSVVTSYSLGLAASASGAWALPGGDQAAVGANAAYEEHPTVTYAPLQGADFVTRLLSPISPSNLVLLSQSGWSIERLLLCCVQKVNDLRNAVAAAGPTPDYVPTFADFQALARLLRKLQIAGLVEAEVDADQQTILLHLGRTPAGPLEEDLREVRRLLGASAGLTTFRITADLVRKKEEEIAVTGRSLLSVLFYLSQAVEVPERDEREGRVTVTRDAAGQRFDWAQVTGNLLRVRASAEPPANAAVRVRYRGAWFYIADDDLSSKTTFSLLTYLYSLKAGSKEMQEPVLTLGVR